MVKGTIKITNPTGLHTRPGQRFVVKAKEFSCDIMVRKGEKEVSAKSLLKLLKLGISEGDTIEVTCNGEAEQSALESLQDFIHTLSD